MTFCCPKCGRLDEVIGDANPSCLHCGTRLIRATQSYAGLWMNPRVAVVRMDGLVEKYGYEVASASGRFKREREAWTSGMFALGLTEMTSKEYWIEIETAEQTPDTKVHYLDQSAGHNRIETQNMEVVDWEPHTENAIDVIKQKCQRAYPPYFCLLVLARNGKDLDFTGLTRELQNLTVPFAEIWILGRVSLAAMVMVRIVPGTLRVDFEIVPCIEKAKRRPEFLVRQKRGTNIAFQDLGPTYLPLP